MSDKPLDCVGIQAEAGIPVAGKHDFKEHPDRPLSPLEKVFMQLMTEATGCGFIDVTPEKKP